MITLEQLEQEKLAVDRALHESLPNWLDDRNAMKCCREIREQQQIVADKIAALRERDRGGGER